MVKGLAVFCRDKCLYTLFGSSCMSALEQRVNHRKRTLIQYTKTVDLWTVSAVEILLGFFSSSSNVAGLTTA